MAAKKTPEKAESFVLVQFRDNWADEMDIAGFSILSKDDWDMRVDHAKKNFGSYREIGFGTNEANTYDSVDEFLGRFTATKITPEEAERFEKIFRGRRFGTFPDPIDYL